MAQQAVKPAQHSATIQASDLKVALTTARMRQHNKGRTCLIAATTPAPIVEVDCSRPNRSSHYRRQHAQASHQRTTLGLLQRGHIAELIERTRDTHGLAEVRATWGTGLRNLLAEDRYALSGGAA